MLSMLVGLSDTREIDARNHISSPFLLTSLIWCPLSPEHWKTRGLQQFSQLSALVLDIVEAQGTARSSLRRGVSRALIPAEACRKRE